MKSILILVLLSIILTALVHAKSGGVAGVWELAETKGVIPLERPYSACSALHGKMYVHGGRTGLASWASSIHAFDFDSGKWEKIALQSPKKQSPPSLAGHTMDAVDDKNFILFGGRKGLWKYSNSVYRFDTSSYTISEIKVEGQKPSPRAKHSSAFVDGKLYIFGGSKDKNIFNDLHVFNYATNKWSQPKTTGTVPPKIEGQSATYAQGKIYIFGGYEGEGKYNTKIFTFDPKKNHWTQLKQRSKPRAFHTASLIGNYVYLVGGYNGGLTPISDIQLFDTLSHQFRRYKAKGSFPARQGHCSSVGQHSLVYIFGGAKSATWRRDSTNELYILDTSPETRKKAQDTKSLVDRLELLMLNINSEILVNDTLASSNQSSIEHLLEKKLAKDIDEFPNLPEKIALWHEIERLYNEYLQSKRSMKDITSSVKFSISETKKVGDGIQTLKTTLGKTVTVVHDRLTEYVGVHNDLEEAKTVRTQAEKLQRDHLATIELTKDRITVLKRNHTRELDLSRRLKSRKTSIIKQIKDVSKILEKTDQEYEKLRVEETLILEKKEKISELRNKTQSTVDVGKLREQIVELTAVGRKIDSRFGKIEKLKKMALSMDSMASEGFSLLKEYLSFRNELLTQLEEMKDLNEKDYKNVPKKGIDLDDNSWIIKFLDGIIQELMGNKRKIVTTIRELKIKITTEGRELQKIEAKYQQWVIRHQEIEKKLRFFKQSQTSSLTQRQNLETEGDAIDESIDRNKLLIEELEVELKTVKKSLESQLKKAQSNKKRISNASAEEEKTQKQLNVLILSLEEFYAKLTRNYKEARALSSNLNRMRSKIVTLKKIYDEEHKQVDNVKLRLIQKIAEAEKSLHDCEKKKETLEAVRKQLDAQIAKLTAKAASEAKRVAELKKQLAAQTKKEAKNTPTTKPKQK